MSLLIAASGCATLVNGRGPQAIRIHATPPGARCDVLDLRSGKPVDTIMPPGTVMLERSAGYFQYGNYQIVCSKEGFKTARVQVMGTANKSYVFGNILIPAAPLYYLLVDPLTGAMWSLSPEVVEIVLAKGDGEGNLPEMWNYSP